MIEKSVKYSVKMLSQRKLSAMSMELLIEHYESKHQRCQSTSLQHRTLFYKRVNYEDVCPLSAIYISLIQPRPLTVCPNLASMSDEMVGKKSGWLLVQLGFCQ